jgi:hypothetical protein
MAMTAQEYLDTFNAAINSGAYEEAARVLRQAEGDFGPGVYDVAGVVLEANPNLPPEIDYMSPQGIQSIRDYVASVPAPVTAASPALNLVNTLPNTGLIPSGNVSGTGAGVVSSGPPVGSLQNPAVQSPIALTPAGIAALAPSANVSSPINVSSPSPPAVDPVDQQAGGLLNQYYAAIDAGDIRTARNLLSQAQNIYGPETLTNVAQDMLSRLNQSMTQAKTTGDFTGAAKLVEAADEIYGGDALQNIADYLNTDLQLLDANKGVRFTPQNLVQFIQQGKGDADVPVDAGVSTGGGEAGTPGTPGTPEGAAAVPTAQTTPGPGQIYGLPRFERQTPTPLTFAPLRRGLAQLRPAAFMPGLTSGQAPLGGSGFTPEQLQQASTRITQEGEAAGKTQEQILADFASLMDVGGVSPAELAAATGRAPGELQGYYNQLRPGGLFGTAPTTPFALPQDFALQTGAYGAPTPTFLARNSTAAGGTAAGPAGVDQPTYAQLLDNVQRLSAQVQPLINRGQVDYGGGEVGFSQEESGRGFFGDMAAAANAMGFGPDPSNDPSNDPSSGFTGSVSGVGSPGDEGVGGDGVDYEVGGLIRMAEGGGPPKMAELFVEDMGSTFDIDDYIKEGILVGGMSKPIRDAYGKIIGYESGDLPLPIQRDVVFGEELRGKEAAMRLTDAEREQMMVEMAMRQGRTGISPTRGGLAGIEIGDPMMRRRPQYYSTVEESRPRYAEGGLASVAQNLADKGRKGDSMLVHMTPDEVAGLQALAQQMGGSLTINPQTGLPEANIFKKLLPMALGFALGPAGAGIFSSALTTGLAVGAGYTLATGSLQQGLAAGLGAYGGSNLGTGLQAAGTADAATSAAASDAASSGLQVAGGAGGAAAEAAMVNPMAHPDFAGTATGSGLDLSFSPNYSLAAPPPSPTSISLTGGAGSGLSLTPEATGFTATGPSIPGSEQLFTQAPKTSSVLTSDVTGLGSTPTPGSALTGAERYFGDKATSDLAAQRYADATGSTLGTSAMQTVGGISLQSAAEEQEAVKAQQAAIDAKRERRKRLFEDIAQRTLGRVNVRSGGLMQLAGGGMSYMEAGGTTGPTGAPRDVVGNGDGMSDSVPADIEGVQEARLADGEFVIPADVVADIGNGSSDAGSKKLYDMMDRVRKARHGTTEQPPEIQAERLMPA